MKHHKSKIDFDFIKKPEEFNKYSKKELLQYCLGAILYTPGTLDIKEKISRGELSGLTTIVLDFEDGIAVSELIQAENNVIDSLEYIYKEIDSGNMSEKDLPLIFIRVRSTDQFKSFSKRLCKKHSKLLTGFEFPKLNTDNVLNYLEHQKYLNEKFNEILYSMPVMEDEKVAHKETRIEELSSLRDIFADYKDIIINLGIGGTDFSSIFSLRRSVQESIYDLMEVKDCLTDIMNFFTRKSDNYVISGPVWEYFSNNDKEINKILSYHTENDESFYKLLLQKKNFINPTVDGLLREIILDKANGFIGKGIIHPSHIKYVNAMQSVKKEDYDDAQQILKTPDGVVKSLSGNKMNEINPHHSWAKKIIYKAKAYGVIEKEKDYIELFKP